MKNNENDKIVASKKKRHKKKSARRQNPLYVVTNKGKDVEPAFGMFDIFIKRYKLTPVIDFFITILKMISENIDNYTSLKGVQAIINYLLQEFKKIVDAIDEWSVPVIRSFQKLINWAR